MAERIVQVSQVRVSMGCDVKDCSGEMLPTGQAYLSSPARYPHVCNVCGVKSTFNKRYPALEFREVNDVR